MPKIMKNGSEYGGGGSSSNFDIENAQVSFTEATEQENINSGETIPTLFGKIKKFFANLKQVAFTADYGDLSNTPANATQTIAGLESADDKKKLDGIEEGANKYELPTASEETLGGVKTTSTVTATTGLTASPIIDGNVYYKNTTYSNATTSTAGLMSSTDKIRLNNLAGAYKSGTVPMDSNSGVIDLDSGYYYIIALNTSNPPHSLWFVDYVCGYNPYCGDVIKITGYSNDVGVIKNPDATNGIVITGCSHSSTTYNIYKLPYQ